LEEVGAERNRRVAMSNKKATKQNVIVVKADACPTIYTNVVNALMTSYDLRLSLLQLGSQKEDGERVDVHVCDVYLPLLCAKALARVLSDHIERYEELYGKIGGERNSQ
jgi:Protein of unknown function (DUF3467)